MIFAKFRELGSGWQVFLWLRAADIHLPVVQRSGAFWKITWRKPAYHSVMQVLHSPIYAGAYAFGRTENGTRVVYGQARKTSGHHSAIKDWNVLIQDSHEGYIDWRAYEENHRMLGENAHMQKRTACKSGRGGQALLSGMARCGRMMRVFYKVGTDQSYRYQCRGDDGHVGASHDISLSSKISNEPRLLAPKLCNCTSSSTVSGGYWLGHADHLTAWIRDVNPRWSEFCNNAVSRRKAD